MITENPIQAGLSSELTLLVAPEHLASRWGSGTPEVLATPQMIGLMEQAAVRAVDRLLPAGQCTVGSRIDVRHVAATPLGHHVTARATLEKVEGRLLTFRVTAEDSAGVVGEGVHERTIIDMARFIARTAARAASTNGTRAG